MKYLAAGIVTLLILAIIIAAMVGYRLGYQARDAEKLKTGIVIHTVGPDGKITERWIIP